MKKVIGIILCICLITVLCIGCSGNSNSSSSGKQQTASEQTSSAPASQPTGQQNSKPADDKVYDLNVNFTHPEASASVQTAMLDKISELSGGRLKFNYYFSNSLVSTPEVVKALGTGVVDISTVPLIMFKDQLVYSGQIISMPFLGIKSVEDCTYFYKDLLEKFPEITAEIEGLGMKCIAWYAMNGYHFHFKNVNNARVPSDLAGKKIITDVTMLTDLITANNGAPIYVPASEYYTSLEKGVAEAVVNNYTNIMNYGAAEQIGMTLDFGAGGINYNVFLVCVSLDLWNSLPADLQQIFLEVQDEWLAGEIERNVTSETKGRETLLARKGYEVVNLSDEELAAWQNAILPLHEKYIDDLETKGFTSAREIYNYIYEHFN